VEGLDAKNALNQGLCQGEKGEHAQGFVHEPSGDAVGFVVRGLVVNIVQFW